VTLARAQLSAKFLLERLRRNVADARKEQYPVGGDGPPKWISLVEGLRSTAEGYLRASENVALTAEVRLDLVDDAASLAVNAYELLVEMRGAHSTELPIPTVKPFQRWLDQLGLSNTAVFRAELLANYELLPFERNIFERPRDPTQYLKDAIAVTNWPVLRITVPAKAFAIVPHLAVVAHEIGHALYQKITPDRTQLASQLTAAEQRVEQILNGSNSAIKSQFISILTSWLEELTADAVMFYLTGPAGFFALMDFLQLASGPNGFSKSHPASFQRRRLLFSRLTLKPAGGISFADVFAKHTGQALAEDINSPVIAEPKNSSEIFSIANQMGHTHVQSVIISELYEVMPHAEQLIYDTVGKYLASNAKGELYTPDRFDQDLTNHFLPMLAAIPPIETGTVLDQCAPTAFSTILNVGWAVVLTKLSELRVKVPANADHMVSKMERLQGLLSKAVELAEARRTWAAA